MDNKCVKCGKPVQASDKFCPHCGNPASVKTNKIVCPKCYHENPEGASFCEKCGTSLKPGEVNQKAEQKDPNKIVSKGTYSRKMTKSKSKFRKRLLWTIIVLVVIIAIALVIWFQVDPEAGEKLKTVGGGILIVVIFLYFVIKGNKKGKRKRRYDNGDYYDNDDNDWDDGGDDD